MRSFDDASNLHQQASARSPTNRVVEAAGRSAAIPAAPPAAPGYPVYQVGEQVLLAGLAEDHAVDRCYRRSPWSARHPCLASWAPRTRNAPPTSTPVTAGSEACRSNRHPRPGRPAGLRITAALERQASLPGVTDAPDPQRAADLHARDGRLGSLPLQSPPSTPATSRRSYTLHFGTS